MESTSYEQTFLPQSTELYITTTQRALKSHATFWYQRAKQSMGNLFINIPSNQCFVLVSLIISFKYVCKQLLKYNLYLQNKKKQANIQCHKTENYTIF